MEAQHSQKCSIAEQFRTSTGVSRIILQVSLEAKAGGIHDFKVPLFTLSFM